MKDIDEIRRENMHLLEVELGGPAEAANRVGMSPAQFTNLKKGAKDSKTGKRRGMRKDTARRLEKAAGKPVGWLDIDHSSPTSNEQSISLDITDLFAQALPEQQAVVQYVLRRSNDKIPEWVDSDARAYADSLESKARRWLAVEESRQEPRKNKA